MIKITVNCNNDTITVEGPSFKKQAQTKNTYQLSVLLGDIFELINDSINTDSRPDRYMDIRLNRVDEDTDSIVGEW